MSRARTSPSLNETFGSDDRVVVTRFNLDEPAPEEIARRRFDAIVAVNVIEHIQDDASRGAQRWRRC